jgi:hypothetical protein
MVALALLGPMWASQAANPATRMRMIVAFSTVVVGFFGVLIAPPFDFARRQTSSFAH